MENQDTARPRIGAGAISERLGRGSRNEGRQLALLRVAFMLNDSLDGRADGGEANLLDKGANQRQSPTLISP